MSHEIRLAFEHPAARASATAPDGPLDRISVRDHVVDVEIGAFQAERGTTQRICFNIVVEVRPMADTLDDDVDRILSYDRVTEAISASLAEERLNLLETLAERIAERILQQASNPRGEAIMIVAVLNAYFDKLWTLQKPGALRKNKYDLAGEIGVSPYFVEEYKHAAQRYTRAAIADAYSALLAADYELKGGAPRDAHLVLTLLLRRLLPPAAQPAA